jgi:hypothetical protein
MNAIGFDVKGRSALIAVIPRPAKICKYVIPMKEEDVISNIEIAKDFVRGFKQNGICRPFKTSEFRPSR